MLDKLFIQFAVEKAIISGIGDNNRGICIANLKNHEIPQDYHRFKVVKSVSLYDNYQNFLGKLFTGDSLKV